MTDRLSWSALSEPARIEKLVQRIEALSAAGVDWIQLREKDLSARACSDLTRAALRRISETKRSARTLTRLLVNDRLDVAFAERAGGAHLGEQSLPVAEAKRLLLETSGVQGFSHDFLLGVSCHSVQGVQTAAAAGADYVFFGPIFATPSKAAYGSPQGIARLAEVCAAVAIPVLAIGGITLETAPSCLAVGASGIAAIRLFQDAPDPAALVRSLRSLEEN